MRPDDYTLFRQIKAFHLIGGEKPDKISELLTLVNDETRKKIWRIYLNLLATTETKTSPTEALKMLRNAGPPIGTEMGEEVTFPRVLKII